MDGPAIEQGDRIDEVQLARLDNAPALSLVPFEFQGNCTPKRTYNSSGSASQRKADKPAWITAIRVRLRHTQRRKNQIGDQSWLFPIFKH